MIRKVALRPMLIHLFTDERPAYELAKESFLCMAYYYFVDLDFRVELKLCVKPTVAYKGATKILQLLVGTGPHHLSSLKQYDLSLCMTRITRPLRQLCSGMRSIV